MSTYASNAVWRHSAARGTDLLVMLALANVADANWVTYPGVEWLAGQVRVSTRNVQYAIRRLIDAGELVVEGAGGRGKLNKYRINLPDEGTRRLVPGAHREAPKDSPETVQKVAPFSGSETVQKVAPFVGEKGCNPAPKGCNPAPKRVQPSADVQRNNTCITRVNTSSTRAREEEEDATAVFRSFCELTNADVSAMPAATVARQVRAAAALIADYPPGDIEGCMRWLRDWRRVPWTLDTVRKEIDEWIAKRRPATGYAAPSPPVVTRSPGTGPVTRADGGTYRDGAHLTKRGTT